MIERLALNRAKRTARRVGCGATAIAAVVAGAKKGSSRTRVCRSADLGTGGPLSRRGVMGELDGRTAIVTGAGRGIGLGIATSLGQHGARVIIAEQVPE